MKTTTRPHYEANTQQEAWKIVNEIFPGDYDYDAAASSRTGYPVYSPTNPELRYAHINDLNTRLEVVLEDYTCINIWFSDLYWSAIENVSLKSQIAAKDNKIQKLENQLEAEQKINADWAKLYKRLYEENAALKNEIKNLKENGYSLLDDLLT